MNPVRLRLPSVLGCLLGYDAMMSGNARVVHFTLVDLQKVSTIFWRDIVFSSSLPRPVPIATPIDCLQKNFFDKKSVEPFKGDR